MTVDELYDEIVGQARTYRGELRVNGLESEAEYALLYDLFLDTLSPLFEGNYEYWYQLQATARHRELQKSTLHYDFRDPQYELPLESQSIRQQLVLLKWYLKRLVYSDHRRAALIAKGGA